MHILAILDTRNGSGTMLKDKFAHDFVYERNGQILQGAEGELSDIA